MAGSTQLHDIDVYAAGRQRAQKHASRRRRKDTVISAALFLVAAAFVVFGGYIGWEIYLASNDENDGNGPERRSPEQVIEQLEDQPKWNGPGAPAFGVGDSP